MKSPDEIYLDKAIEKINMGNQNKQARMFCSRRLVDPGNYARADLEVDLTHYRSVPNEIRARFLSRVLYPLPGLRKAVKDALE